MNIDYSKIEEVYGVDIVDDLKNNYEVVKDNYNYMLSLGFNDIEDYIKRLPMLFLSEHYNFKNKLDTLIKKLGNDYIEKIENDISLLEDLL